MALLGVRLKILLALPLRMLAVAPLRVSKSSAPMERDGGRGGTAGLAKLQGARKGTWVNRGAEREPCGA